MVRSREPIEEQRILSILERTRLAEEREEERRL